MIIRIIQSVSMKKFLSGLLVRQSILPTSSSYKLSNHKAKISIYVGSLKAPSPGAGLNNPKIVARLIAEDRIPPNYTLIYRSNLPWYLVMSQVVVVCSLVSFGVLSVCLGLKKLEEESEDKPTKAEGEATNLKSVPVVAKDLNIVEKIAESTDSTLKSVLGPTGEDAKIYPPNPSPHDIEQEEKMDMQVVGMLLLSLALLPLSMFRLQRMVPARIYTKENKHCIAIVYGSLIPGRITSHEFLAGTVKSTEKPNSIFAPYIFKDGTGKKMVLMEHFFRTPADFNRLLGKGFDKP